MTTARDEDRDNLLDVAHEEEIPGSAGESEVEADNVAGDFQADVTQLYLNELGKRHLFSAADEKVLARRVKQGDFDSRQRMIEHNLGSWSTSPSITSIADCRCSTSSKKVILA